MLRPSKDLQDLAIVARDDVNHDAIGDVKDLFFDDEARAIRYLVVETGSRRFSRKVPISPIDTDMPLMQQHETDHLDDHRDPHDWGGTGMPWGPSGSPMLLPPGDTGCGRAPAARAGVDPAGELGGALRGGRPDA